MDTPPPVVQRYDGAEGWWEIASRSPAEPLRPWLSTYQGYIECARGHLSRRHLPADAVVLIIGLGEPLRFTSTDGALSRAPRGSFVGGLSDTYVTSEWSGLSSGIQVNLSPPGARLMLGQPLRPLANQVVELEDVVGPAAPLLVERLHDLGGWEARFRLLDDVFMRRFASMAAPHAALHHTWDRLAATAGAVTVETLAHEVGWSSRYLSAQFRDEFGLAPKRMARVLRFNRALAVLGGQRHHAAGGPSWPVVASACGYYDQSHLVRDFRAFTGYTPGEFERRRLAGMLDVLD